MINADKQRTHQLILRAVAQSLNDTPMILKGGTALLLAHGLDRHSEDLDFDSPVKINLESRLRSALRGVGVDVEGFKLKKNTDTVQRYMLDITHRATGYRPDKHLKIETSFRSGEELKAVPVEMVDGIRTYPVDTLFRQKLDAITGRTVARDLFDLRFMMERHLDRISRDSLSRAAEVTQNYAMLAHNFEEAFMADPILCEITNAEEQALDLRAAIEAALTGERSVVRFESRRSPEIERSLTRDVSISEHKGSVTMGKPVTETMTSALPGDISMPTAASKAGWFNLATYDSKVERVSSGMAGYELRLVVPSSRVEPLLDPNSPEPLRTVEDLGWKLGEKLENGSYLFINYGDMNRKSEIVTALRPFFSEAELSDTHGPLHELEQDETVDGLEPRVFIASPDLTASIDGVRPEDHSRIFGAVAEAQKRVAARAERQAHIPFGGKGREVAMMLSDALRSERGMDDVDAAIASFEMLRDAASRPLGNIARRLDLLGEAIHSNDATAIREGVSYAVEMASIPRPEDRLRGEFADWVRKAEASGAGVRILDVAFADTHRLFPANHMSRLTAESRETLEYYSSRLPFAVRRDTAAPTASVVQYMKAVDRVLDVVARELDLPKNSLLPDQKTVPLRFSYSAVSADDSSEGNVMTLQSKETADDIDARVAMVINVSVTRGRTFLHELGHVIDAGNKLSIGSESRDNILLTSGILAAAQESVGRLYPEGGDFADYLLSNSEVFARSFEAHICNVMMRDGVFEEAGGLLISHGYDVAAPFGDLELSERFMASLRAEIGARKDAAYDQDVAKRAERDVEPPAYSTDYSAGP